MALEIIGAGFGRTGTTSLYTALNELGFPCYHMFEVLKNAENKSHLDFWRNVANSEPGTRHNWEQVFSKYTAALDNPACCVWKELVSAYPDARVVLTLHPKGAEAWYDSTMDTIYFTETMWQFKVLEFTTPFGRKFGDMARKLIWQRSHKGTMNDRDKAIAHYNRHIEDVKAMFHLTGSSCFQSTKAGGRCAISSVCRLLNRNFPTSTTAQKSRRRCTR